MAEGDPGVSRELGGEGMVMGGKQQPAVHLATDVLQHSMGDGIAIKGAGASPQLIQDHQAVWSCVLQQITCVCVCVWVWVGGQMGE